MTESAFERSLVPAVAITLPVGRNEDKSYIEQEFTLIADCDAYCLVEEHTNRNLLLGTSFAKLNLREFGLFLWAFLNRAHPELELKKVRRMIVPGHNVAYILEKLMAAWQASRPEPKEEEAVDASANPPKPLTK